ncbi:MAG TPA: hypothetical protein PLZ74_06620 [Kiritimatiellia bacterium]|nr:hypothetical protein [Kiritimatiellia bacterium]
MKPKSILLAVLISVCSAPCSVFAQGWNALLDWPVSTVTNKAYLTSMTERPWWNDAWQKRVPLLVSGQADEKDDKVIVDAIVDLGEKVEPKEVRVVTPWETVVPCVCEKAEGSKVRLLFKTTLRQHENKPFLVYFGNPAAQAEKISADVTLETDEHTFRIRNGVLDVVFDRRHVTEGLIRSLRILGSNCRTVFFDRATGYAKAGFVFHPNATNSWDKGTVTADNALVKSIRFECADSTLTFTLYAEQPRIDWSYEIHRGDEASIRMNWGLGTGSAFDDFFYCGKNGKILTQRAGLDHVTDSMTNPEGRFEDWLGEGWYAIGERRMGDIAGLAFDVTAAGRLGYDSYYGVSAGLKLRHKLERGEKAAGSGAVVATLGDVNDYRRICKRIAKPVIVSVGAVQAKVAKPYRIPRLDRDFCFDHNVGYGYGGDSGTAEPLMKDPAWADRICERLRSYGSTAVCLMGYPWWMMPIEDKALYDRLIAAQTSGAFEDWVPKRKSPSWEEMKGRGQEILAFTKAIHAKGMGVHTWCGFVPGWSSKANGHFMKEINDLSVDMMSLRVKCGQDCGYSNAIEGEGVALPSDLVKKNGGSPNYWSWENPQEAFDKFDFQHGLMRDFYTKFKKLHPDIPVFLWNSENGEYSREKFMSEDEGYFDTMVVEMLPHAGFPHTKHVSKRMRSHFNNRVGHTVWHHYYIMNPKTTERIYQIEWPFVCGVNGFSQENLSYETKDLEMSEVTADFFRFAEYTCLGDKVARMAPVKNVGVYRDPKMFRADVLKKRLDKPYGAGSQQDGRVRSFSEIKNFAYDVIGPKFFTAKDLAQYRVVYVPEDEVLAEGEAKELLAYAEQGGNAVFEGELSDGAKKVFGELEDAKVKTLGKGKVLWFKDVRTDRLAKRDAKAIAEMRKTIADLGGVEPFTLTGSWMIDGILQAGPDGMFLGAYNDGRAEEKGIVTLSPTVAHVRTTPLYVLDVKTGIRRSVTNGVFEIAVAPRQCGYYLIGDDAFTAVPVVKVAEWKGAGVGSFRPRPHVPPVIDITGFKPIVAIEFVRANQKGKPIRIARSVEAKYDVRAFTPASYDVKDCKAALAEARFIHFIDTDTKAMDLVFADCAEELKALLKRSGTILISRSETGPAAQKFFKEIEVFDPNPSAKAGVGDTWATWCGPEDHPYLTSCHKSLGKEEEVWGTKFWLWRSLCNYFQYRRVFGAWDAAKQQVLFRPKVDGEKYAGLVIQEKVLGTGRVIFNENQRCFTDWYESKQFGDNWLSYITGVPSTEHAIKATAYHGGLGEIVEPKW